ncbi:cupin domain-containing protein [Verminephrobacter eiseniae]|uniref:cupin domain-containing protein n=1 Tax=Verminephrobacter eiseniae TaxID=364317 RepID=UPI002237179A|nr:cupin domain-containing protein [Verminephrobacter eiseniae]
MPKTDTHDPISAANDFRHSSLEAGAGEKVWMSGDEYQILLDAKNSGGAMTLINALVPPGGGPPTHAHGDVDELFFVVDGELEIIVDEVPHRVTAGGRVFVRRNVPHAFMNRTSAPARMLIFYTPGGVEEFFLAAGRPAINGVAPPPSTEESRAREVKVASGHHIAPATEIICQGPCPANPEEQLI